MSARIALPKFNPQSAICNTRKRVPEFSVLAFWGLLGASLLALVVTPWPIAGKLYAIVHGLCAQRPSHSFALGGTNLPFDARMAGIYGGTLTTLLFLTARGRWRAIRLPSWPVLAALASFVVVMGLDGVNSTLMDFGYPYAYEPDNRLRLATGLLMGVALGVMLCYLTSATLWAYVEDAPILRGWRELALLLVCQGGMFLLIASGWGWLYLPVALALVGGAVTAVLLLSLTSLILLYRRENRARRPADVAGFASAALLLGYAVMALIAVGRWYLETTLGVELPL
jgi:uncharacterized membrane protein